MARARNIKPGFFTNDQLAEIHPLGRILFAGLWTIADRAGRLEDRPKKIKAEVLPFDNCNADKLLSELDKHGFIQRYEIDGIKYIQVINWDKHQNPHIKEAESTIPAPCSIPKKNSTSTVQEPDETQPKPERAGLIQSLDSLNLIPDSGFVVVVPADWWPPEKSFTDLKMLHGFMPDWIDQQVPSFIEYWNERGEPLRSPVESLFADHCVARSKLRSVAP